MRKSQENKLKMDRKNALGSGLPPSMQDFQDIIKNLQNQLKEEKEKRQKIENHLVQFRIRSLKRQKQFFKILDKFNTNKSNSIKENAEIEAFYKRILVNFDAANEKTHIMLENKYKRNYEFMERKVKEITECMQEQLSTNKKLSKDSLKSIKEQINEVLIIAKGIQEEDQENKKTIKDLEFKNNLLREEKKLLIEEIVLKKKMIVEISDKNNKRESISASQSRVASSRKYNLTIQTNHKCTGPLITDFPVSTTPQSRKSYKTRYQKHKERANSSFLINKAEDIMVKQQRKSAKPEKIIQNLQNSLRREKNKSLQLGSIVTHLQQRDKEINEALEEFMLKNKSSQSDLQYGKDYAKLVATMKSLKRRLSMTENPKVACGWNNELDQLLQ